VCAKAVTTEAHVHVVAERYEQAGSVAEVEVDGLARDTSLRGDVGDSNAGPPFLKQRPRGIEDAPACLRISVRHGVA